MKSGHTYDITIVSAGTGGKVGEVKGAKVVDVDLPLVTYEFAGNQYVISVNGPFFVGAKLVKKL